MTMRAVSMGIVAARRMVLLAQFPLEILDLSEQPLFGSFVYRRLHGFSYGILFVCFRSSGLVVSLRQSLTQTNTRLYLRVPLLRVFGQSQRGPSCAKSCTQAAR